jgi:hypothetical protein
MALAYHYLEGVFHYLAGKMGGMFLVNRGNTMRICTSYQYEKMNETCFIYIGNFIFTSRYCSSVMLILEKYIIPNANEDMHL